MAVSRETIFHKMEECMKRAKNSDTTLEMREHLRALQALCDVLLDDRLQAAETLSKQEENISSSIQSPISVPRTSLGSKKLETDDGANGDSIFDF
ncbi:MAG TPA: YwdI family protein [Bacillus sp. (in: firmicutes)]|uniref:YwdI family protein n=1 Tax=Bacillus litorisediminis TaxID=2922713 RepID=UPI001FAC905F|nr:YwdI family protein [Bacillus litorisediminis]HWO77009.1 YwdI family protein [Bacillus sp. (in: firmicutes)]